MESFEQMVALDAGALEHLLGHGRAEERVWAIWALAMRAGEAALDAGARIADEPNAGVRRTLAVMLAGQGATTLLVELARHDPELAVRETAIQLATRLACGGRLDVAVVLEIGRTDPALRIAVLGAIGSTAPEALVTFARQQLTSGELAVQLEAFEALIRIGTPAARDRARGWLARTRDLGVACGAWLRAAGPLSLAEAAASLPEDTRGRVLSHLRAPPWRAVELLVGGSPALMRGIVYRTDIAIPARAIARAILAGIHSGFVELLTERLASAGRGRALTREIQVAIERTVDHAAVRTIAERVREFAQAIEVAEGTGVLDELADQHPVEHLLGLDNAMQRWLADVDAPPDLVPLLPDLHDYVQNRLAALRPARLEVRALAAAYDDMLDDFEETIETWDGHAAFLALRAAIERILPRN